MSLPLPAAWAYLHSIGFSFLPLSSGQQRASSKFSLTLNFCLPLPHSKDTCTHTGLTQTGLTFRTGSEPPKFLPCNIGLSLPTTWHLGEASRRANWAMPPIGTMLYDRPNTFIFYAFTFEWVDGKQTIILWGNTLKSGIAKWPHSIIVTCCFFSCLRVLRMCPHWSLSHTLAIIGPPFASPHPGKHTVPYALCLGG